DNTFFQSPGRMNIFDEHGFRVILDYGHNEAAVGAMVDLVERLAPLGKRIVCITVPGDRRDEDIRAIAERIAGHFDTYICHRDDNPRGRAPDEVPKLMRAALLDAGVPEEAIHLAESETASIDAALGMARPNDLVLVFCDAITRAWKQIIYFQPAEPPRPVPPEQRLAASGFDVPEGWRIESDDRGVRIVPTG
ncbi:MAG TPA: cyanophycin synthetase, partial [Amaricoccus sp.]|nr:cyanophycin synthetase [Amaricoccus sp.]